MTKFFVSQSKVNTYLRCQAAYHQKYILGLSKKRKSRALTFGSIFHDMMELHDKGKDAIKVISKRPLPKMLGDEQEIRETVEAALTIFPEYVEHWKRYSLTPIKRKGKVLVEANFEIEILPHVIWNGRIDKYARSSDKHNWLVEHKTFSKMPGEDERWRNFQSSTYFRAIEIMGWPPPGGILWDYIRSSMPKEPQVLKSGAFSTKKIYTLPSVIKETAKKRGIALSDNKQLLKDAMSEGRPYWFSRIRRPIKPPVVNFLMEQFLGAVQGMIDYEDQVKSYHEPAMTIGRHCDWCDFRDICRARIEGGDPDYVKSKEYTTHDRKKKNQSRPHKISYKESQRIQTTK